MLAPRRRAAEEHRLQPDDVLPAHGLAGGAPSRSKRTVGRSTTRASSRYYRIIAESLSDTFEPASAWTFSRIGGGMIDEYIVDYEDYVGIGSRRVLLPRRRALREHVLAADVRRSVIDAGQTSVVADAPFAHRRPDALPLPDVAVRRCDSTSASSRADFGDRPSSGPAVGDGVHARGRRVRRRQRRRSSCSPRRAATCSSR